MRIKTELNKKRKIKYKANILTRKGFQEGCLFCGETKNCTCPEKFDGA